MIVELKRYKTGDDGTLGVLYTEGFSCATIELPWRHNMPFISCIPNGIYPVVPHKSPTKGNVYLLKETGDRTDILFHIANWAGDRSKKFKSELMGCIAPGLYHSELVEQVAAISSSVAMERMREFFGDKSFTLVIENLFGTPKIIKEHTGDNGIMKYINDNYGDCSVDEDTDELTSNGGI